MHVRRQTLHEFFKVIDLAIVAVAFALAYLLVRLAIGGTFTEVAGDVVQSKKLIGGIFLLILWHLTFERLGLYGSRRLISWTHEAFGAFKAATMGSILVVASGVVVSFGAKSGLDTGKFGGIFWVTATSLTLLSRLSIRAVLERARRQGRNLRRVLMVGTNARALEFARKIEAKPEMGYKVVGFVDEHWPGMEEFRKSGWGLVSGFGDELKQYLRENVVDEVAVALPFSTAYRESSNIVSLCEDLGITVRFVSQIFDTRLAKADIEVFEGEPILTLESGAAKSGPMFLKRVIDLSATSLALVLLSPIFLAVSLAIWGTSGRPIFFKQQRLGRNKRPFWLYKFRTMVPNAEAKLKELEHLNEVSGPVFKIQDDPRLISIGSFLRRTSLDELPQLWNVLIGDMSLVGPRPLPFRDYEGFELDTHRRRFTVAPGITCLWQVKGRSAIPFDRWMMLDLEYIDEWSLWLDLKILVKTVPVLLFGDGDITGVEEIPETAETVLDAEDREAFAEHLAARAERISPTPSGGIEPQQMQA